MVSAGICEPDTKAPATRRSMKFASAALKFADNEGSRPGRYFQRAGWIGKKINHRALGRAIEVLDGVIECR